MVLPLPLWPGASYAIMPTPYAIVAVSTVNTLGNTWGRIGPTGGRWFSLRIARGNGRFAAVGKWMGFKKWEDDSRIRWERFLNPERVPNGCAGEFNPTLFHHGGGKLMNRAFGQEMTLISVRY
eukprot:COSAG02_NODE_5416_length_4347_cov_10.934793_2_plen_123_part_00